MINLTVFCSSKDNLDDNLHLEIQKFIQLLDVNKKAVQNDEISPFAAAQLLLEKYFK